MARKKKHGKKRSYSQTNLKQRYQQWPFYILEGIAAVLLVAGYMVSLSPSHKIWAVWIFFAALMFVAFGVAIRLTQEFSESPPNNSDKEFSSQLTEPKRPSASPTVSRPTASPSPPPSPTETPATTLPFTIPSPTKLPSTTPEHRVASLSFEDVKRKLSEAIRSTESGKYDEVKNALKGLRVDWTLNFFSANRDSSGKSMEVWLNDPERILGLVVTKLPLAGNERLPLMEKTDVFRVRGIIDDADVTAIRLRDATLEYVSSDKK